VQPERDRLLTLYESAVHAFTQATEGSRGLAGHEFYKAMMETDRLFHEVERLELMLAEYDQAMR
jgi:hypothetical protein